MRFLFIFFVSFYLAACASPAQIAQEHDQWCKSIGAAPGSSDYMQCRLIVEQQRQNREAAAGEAALAVGLTVLNNAANSGK